MKRSKESKILKDLPTRMVNDLSLVAEELNRKREKFLLRSESPFRVETPITAESLYGMLVKNPKKIVEAISEDVASAGEGRHLSENPTLLGIKENKFKKLRTSRENLVAFFLFDPKQILTTKKGPTVSGLVDVPSNEYVLDRDLYESLQEVARVVNLNNYGERVEGSSQFVTDFNVLQVYVSASYTKQDDKMYETLVKKWSQLPGLSEHFKILRRKLRNSEEGGRGNEDFGLIPSQYVGIPREDGARLRYEGINRTVDAVIFRKNKAGLVEVLMIKKGDGLYHLPGGFIDLDRKSLLEDLNTVGERNVAREVAEEITLIDPNGKPYVLREGGFLKKGPKGSSALIPVDDPRNDNISRVETELFTYILPDKVSSYEVQPGPDTGEVKGVKWVNVSDILSTGKSSQEGEDIVVSRGHLPLVFESYLRFKNRLNSQATIAMKGVQEALENKSTSGEYLERLVDELIEEINTLEGSFEPLLGPSSPWPAGWVTLYTRELRERVTSALCKVAVEADIALNTGNSGEFNRIRQGVSERVSREVLPTLLETNKIESDMFSRLSVKDIFRVVEVFLKLKSESKDRESINLENNLTPEGVMSLLKDQGAVKEGEYFVDRFATLFKNRDLNTTLSKREFLALCISLMIINAAWKLVQFHRAILERKSGYVEVKDTGNFQESFGKLIEAMREKGAQKSSGGGDVTLLAASRAVFEVAKDLWQVIKAFS